MQQGKFTPRPFVYQVLGKDDSISTFYKTNTVKNNAKCTLANARRKQTELVSSSVLNEIILPNSLECFSRNKNNKIGGRKPEFTYEEEKKGEIHVPGGELRQEENQAKMSLNAL